MTATDGPERSGSAEGFPVPRRTTWARDSGTVDAGVEFWARLVVDSRFKNSTTKNVSGIRGIMVREFTYQRKFGMARHQRSASSRIVGQTHRLPFYSFGNRSACPTMAPVR